MAYTTPRTWVANETLTASNLNTHVRDNIAWLATDAPCCRVYNSANISIATSGSPQALTFDSERYDVGGCHSTSVNTGRITVPSGAGGKWRFGASIEFASNATGYRQVFIRLNGGSALAAVQVPAVSGVATQLNVSGEYSLSAADYLEVVVTQTSGAALNVTATGNYGCEFYASWMRT